MICSVCEADAPKECVAACERCKRLACTDCYWFDAEGERVCEDCLLPGDGDKIRARQEARAKALRVTCCEAESLTEAQKVILGNLLAPIEDKP